MRKFVRLSREKTNRSSTCDLVHDGIISTSDPDIAAEPIPLQTLSPTQTNIDDGPSCSKRHEGLSGMTDSDLHFVENIFDLLRKEESFSGQVKLLRWILQMKNPSVLNWYVHLLFMDLMINRMNCFSYGQFLCICRFLTEGGLMILATWLCEAAKEEQTSYLLVTLKVLSYLTLIFYMIFITMEWL